MSLLLLSGGLPPPILTRLSAMGYPAAAAWSVARRLRAAYTGALIRVRRSNDNAEQDIGYLGSCALDTAALLAFCGAGNGFVAKVYDQGGSGYDMAQATAGNQPRIVNSGALDTMGGAARPALNFVGTGKSLENATYTHGSAATVNVAAVSDGAASASVSVVGNTTGTNGRARIGGGGQMLLGDLTGVGSTTLSAGALMIATGSVSGTGTVIAIRRLGGAQDAAVSVQRGAPGAGISWGSNNPGAAGLFAGKCAEFVAFNSAVSDAALSTLERDQGRFFGITVA